MNRSGQSRLSCLDRLLTLAATAHSMRLCSFSAPLLMLRAHVMLRRALRGLRGPL